MRRFETNLGIIQSTRFEDVLVVVGHVVVREFGPVRAEALVVGQAFAIQPNGEVCSLEWVGTVPWLQSLFDFNNNKTVRIRFVIVVDG